MQKIGEAVYRQAQGAGAGAQSATGTEGKPGQPTGGARRVTGARVRGGYFFGPARKRR